MLKYDIKKILFLDIETVPGTARLEDLEPSLASLWSEKFAVLKKRLPEKYAEDSTVAEAYEKSAGIYSEFGKIICISVGFINDSDGILELRIKSFFDEDESKILRDFADLVTRHFAASGYNLCGHNIKEFDIPYICRRMLIHGIPLPVPLQLSGKKPWETPLLDTLEFWKFGDMKTAIPLKLLTAILGVPTPKDDIDGSQVADVFYKEKDLERIVTYCQKDVVATVQVFLKLNGLRCIEEKHIVFPD